jgi:2-dehydropantoate 2-reductase
MPHCVSDSAQVIGPQDIVILSVKSTALRACMDDIQGLINESTHIWTAMNGLPWWFANGLDEPCAGRTFESIDPGGLIQARYPLTHWMGGVVHASCSLKAPGHALHHFGNGLIVGEPISAPGQPSVRCRELVDLLLSVGFDAQLSPRIQQDIWYKLWGNMTMNPISALTGATIDKILDDAQLYEFVCAVMMEAKQLGAKIGLPIEQNPQDRNALTRKLGAFKTSMLQDVENKRALELDALLSCVVEMASWTQTPVPFTSALLGLTRVKAQQMGLY